MSVSVERPTLYAEWHRSAAPRTAPIVLINSLGVSLRSWDEVVRHLTPYADVLRFDYRGHGLSAYGGESFGFDDVVDDLLALMDRESIQTAHLAGVSLGGMVSLSAASLHPTRVQSVTPMCCGAVLPRSDWYERSAAVRAGGMRPLVDVVVPRWFTDEVRVGQPALVERYLGYLIECDPEAYALFSDALAGVDIRPLLPAVRCTTTVVSASEDIATPPEFQKLIADTVPGAALVSVRGAAHMITATAAPEVAEVILRTAGISG